MLWDDVSITDNKGNPLAGDKAKVFVQQHAPTAVHTGAYNAFSVKDGKGRSIDPDVVAKVLKEALGDKISGIKVKGYELVSTPPVRRGGGPSLSVPSRRGETNTINVFLPRDCNTVTPHIGVEYKVVLLDRNLSQHQETSETKIFADVTRVELWFTQTNGNIPYEKGATFECSPANAEVYRDEACQTKLDGDLTAEDIAGGKKLKLYLKGKTAGKFTAKFALKDPESGQILLADNPAQEEMGVVQLEFKLHQQDLSALAKIQIDPDTDPISTYHTNLKDKALPDLKEMTDAEKVKTGRLLHEQKDGHFSRAKLILKKLNADQWPSGTDEYEVCLYEKNTSGAVAVHGKEWDADIKTFPVKVTVADLKAADKEFWVEGKSAVKKLRDVKLDAGVDRPSGGLNKEAKRNGDWARFTVVKISEVKVDYEPETGKAVAWDSAKSKFYINFKSDPDGRKITIRATLSEKLKDIVIHFMLAEDKDNRKKANWTVDLPATWKWKDITADVKHLDKSDRKNLLHLDAKTDDDGIAKKELTLSRFGGDKFYPAAYIEQDPHLAKFIDGHTDLEKKKPVMASKPVTVYRKFWYQRIKVQGMTVPAFTDGGPTSAVGQYTRVKADMSQDPDIELTKATVGAFSPQAIYRRYMIEVKGGNSDALVVSDDNKNQFFKDYSAAADKPVRIPILVCDAQWDPAEDSSGALTTQDLEPKDFPYDVRMDTLVLTPPLQGGELLVSGEWIAKELDAKANGGKGGYVPVRNGKLANGDLSVNPDRNSLQDVRVALPAGALPANASPAQKAITRIVIKDLVIHGADAFLGEYENTTKRILVVYDPVDKQDFQNTVAHELGHAFHQVKENGPTGTPTHPNYYYQLGEHCKYATDKCVMYDAGPVVGSYNQFCDVCHPYVIVEDLSKLS